MANVRQYEIVVSAATGNTDIVIQTGITVSSFHLIKTDGNGTNSDTVQLFKVVGGVSQPITQTIDLAVSDKTTIGPSGLFLDTSADVINAGATIRISAVNNTNCACRCYVTGIPNLE